MQRLQTYFALLSTLMTILACALVTLGFVLVYNAPPLLFLLIAPASCITFALSITISYFLTEPLRRLRAHIQAFHAGDPAAYITPSGRIHEIDRLAESFEELARRTMTYQSELAAREHNQAEFISDVAHELRTPLTAIRGNAEMLLDPDLPPELHDKFCRIIVAESERLGRLSNDLLTLQRIEDERDDAELERIELKALAESVVDTLEPILRERQANTLVVGEAPDVLGHPDRLRQVVSNLVENASRFIEPGGLVTVELIGLEGNSVITVKDNGPGFGDVNPARLFDRFYRADSSRSRGTGGTGLGLAIVKTIVEGHDGTVQAFNLPEGGACFMVAIPSITAGEDAV